MLSRGRNKMQRAECFDDKSVKNESRFLLLQGKPSIHVIGGQEVGLIMAVNAEVQRVVGV